MQGLADSAGVRIAAMICGGALGRVLAAYCESGSLDTNMRQAAGDLRDYYRWSALLLTIAGLACPPLIIVSGLLVALAQVLDALSKGQTPSPGAASAVASAAAPVAQQYATSNGIDTAKVADSAGAFQAAAASPAMRQAAGVAAAKLPPPAPPSCSSASQNERNAQRAIALAAAKAKAKYITAHENALACATAKARVASGGTAPSSVVIDGRTIAIGPWCKLPAAVAAKLPPGPSTPPAAKPSGSKLALILGGAAVAAKLAGVLG